MGDRDGIHVGKENVPSAIHQFPAKVLQSAFDDSLNDITIAEWLRHTRLPSCALKRD